MFSTTELLFLCVFLAVLAGLLAGYLGAVAKNLALSRDVTDHSYRLEDLEGKLIRETKIRAQQQSLKAKDLDREIMSLAGNGESKPDSLSLSDWRNKGFLRK